MAKKIVIINAAQEGFQDYVQELNDLLEEDWTVKVFNVFDNCIFYYELQD